MHALGDRLPAAGAGRPPSLRALVELRAAVRAALQATLDGAPHDPAALALINRASAAAPRSPAALWRPDGAPLRGTDHRGASRARIVLAALARDAIDLIAGPRGGALRACSAPGCVLLFLKDHPRREWCSNACGNRARQARHYERARRSR